MGIVNMVVKKDELEDAAMKIAGKMAGKSPLAVAETKKLLRGHYERGHEEQSRIERETQLRMAKSHDFKEGIEAFFEKRKPEWKNS